MVLYQAKYQLFLDDFFGPPREEEISRNNLGSAVHYVLRQEDEKQPCYILTQQQHEVQFDKKLNVCHHKIDLLLPFFPTRRKSHRILDIRL